TNASAGVHIAMQDSVPMILFIGQVASHAKEREAFQEVDYKRFFGDIAKWVVEIDDAARIPEFVTRAFAVATSGRPGPVVISLPEDMLTSEVEAPKALPHTPVE
ncbi:MAG: thiamine pyrophosphate-binding protein, partial [Mesorhizobium sp.]